MNEQERIESIIDELEIERGLSYDYDGIVSGIDLAIRIIRSYYPPEETYDE
jgi:hypothetical protein